MNILFEPLKTVEGYFYYKLIIESETCQSITIHKFKDIDDVNEAKSVIYAIKMVNKLEYIEELECMEGE